MADMTHAEAERAVLGALLLDGGQLEEVRLDPLDFADDRHRLIFTAMIETKRANLHLDIRTAQATLERRGWLASVGGIAYLEALDMALPDLTRVAAYARLVREAAIRRRLVVELRSAASELAAGKDALSTTLWRANVALREADRGISGSELHPLAESFDRVLERMDKPTASGLVGITTGYRELDRMTLGFSGGQFVVIAGRPGMGKTALACCMARAAVEAGSPGVLFSLEMGREDLAARMLCAETGLPFWKLRSGHLSAGERELARRGIIALSRLSLHLDDSANLTPARLSAAVRLARRQGATFATVDYLGLMAPDHAAETQNLRLASISRELKVLAKELDMPIIALHQLSRAPDKRQDPRPMLSDLRDSGAIEQDADLVLFIYRDGADGRPVAGEAPPDADLIVAKQRNGMTGTVRLRQRLEVFRFDAVTL